MVNKLLDLINYVDHGGHTNTCFCLSRIFLFYLKIRAPREIFASKREISSTSTFL